MLSNKAVEFHNSVNEALLGAAEATATPQGPATPEVNSRSMDTKFFKTKEPVR